MVRSGWKVRLAEDLQGSFEECPTTVRDYAKRDQRWCQGNLQHWKVALAEGFHPLSRFHLISGILAYTMSPMWMLFLAITATVGFFGPSGATPTASAGDSVSLIAWSGSSIALWLFVAAMAMLFIPKILAVVSLMHRQEACDEHGGRVRLLCSFVLESVLSVLFAPINALHHTRFVLSACLGWKVGWGSQQRDEHGVGLSEAIRDCLGITLLGSVIAVVFFAYQPSLLPWMAPVLLGWILSIPIVILMASTRVGQSLNRLGLLRIAQETHPEPICQAYHAWATRLQTTAATAR